MTKRNVALLLLGLISSFAEIVGWFFLLGITIGAIQGTASVCFNDHCVIEKRVNGKGE